jgi:methylenetetrahydrofolate dehydrogenase (NADP+)/methenyltetrahydrofolate cyclohydrolase
LTDKDIGKLIDGKKAAKELIADLAADIEDFSRKHRPPRLAVIIVGEDPASQVYVGMKVKSSAKCGIDSTLIEMHTSTTEDELLSKLDNLNDDRNVDGILVQMPLPDHINQQKVIESISPDKDVDGLHPYNLGRIVSDNPRFVPCTPRGILHLLESYGVEIEGRNAVVIGRSVLVGKPMALLLSMKKPNGNATVSVCHSRSRDMKRIIGEADILIAAVGKANMITGDMVKEGVVAVDVGINRVDDPEAKRGYRLIGDIEFESVHPKASLITPVPGGVGPMTVAMLMKNTFQAAKWALGAGDER